MLARASACSVGAPSPRSQQAPSEGVLPGRKSRRNCLVKYRHCTCAPSLWFAQRYASDPSPHARARPAAQWLHCSTSTMSEAVAAELQVRCRAAAGSAGHCPSPTPITRGCNALCAQERVVITEQVDGADGVPAGKAAKKDKKAERVSAGGPTAWHAIRRSPAHAATSVNVSSPLRPLPPRRAHPRCSSAASSWPPPPSPTRKTP